jgi:hypothetical protein
MVGPLVHVGYPKAAPTYVQRQIFKRIAWDGNATFAFASYHKLLSGEDCLLRGHLAGDLLAVASRALSRERVAQIRQGLTRKRSRYLAGVIHKLAPPSNPVDISRGVEPWLEAWARANQRLSDMVD